MFLGGPPIDVERLNQRDWWADVDMSAGLVECWPWLKSTASHGYGQTWDGVTVRLAHRVAWTLAVGPIPVGLTVDHVCRNPRCCNPAHLQLLTNVDNARKNRQAERGPGLRSYKERLVVPGGPSHRAGCEGAGPAPGWRQRRLPMGFDARPVT